MAKGVLDERPPDMPERPCCFDAGQRALMVKQAVYKRGDRIRPRDLTERADMVSLQHGVRQPCDQGRSVAAVTEAKGALHGHQNNIASGSANRCRKRKIAESYLDRRSTKPHSEERSKQHRRSKDQATANPRERECMQACSHSRAFCKEYTSWCMGARSGMSAHGPYVRQSAGLRASADQ